MTVWLKQSTAVTLVMGPFVDATDGATAEIALDITEQEVLLSKNGGAFTLKSDTTHGVHDAAHNGWYTIPLNTTDTNTLGCLSIAINMAGALPVWKECMVVAADAWDSLFGAVVLGQAGAQAALVANNLDHLCKTATAGVDMTTEVTDGTIISRMISSSDTSTFVPATHSLAVVGADVAATHVHAAAADTATVAATIQADCNAALIANNLDHLALTATSGADMTTEVADNTILSRIIGNGDTSTFVPSTDGLHAAGVDIDAILLDTGTTLDGRIPAALVSGRIDASVGAVAANAIDAAAIKDGAIDAATFAAGAIDAAAINDAAIDNATFAADVGSTAYASNIIALAVNKSIVQNNLDTKSGYSLSAAGIDSIWDEAMSGHLTLSTAGRYLRDASGAAISTGTLPSQAGLTSIQVKLAAAEPDTAHLYDQQLVCITSGTGIGQTRMIVDYGGATSLCTVNRPWDVQPVSGDEYAIIGASSFLFTNCGIAAAADASHITLASTASAVAGAYIGSMIVITGGTGMGQARLISAYAVDTFIATVTPNWTTTPDTTSTYVVIPVGRSIIDSVAAGAITAAAIATDAIDADALAANAVDEILDEVVEGTVTVRQALMVLLAAVSGKASGGGTTTIKFRDSTDAKDRITLTVDAAGDRSASVLDVAAT